MPFGLIMKKLLGVTDDVSMSNIYFISHHLVYCMLIRQ